MRIGLLGDSLTARYEGASEPMLTSQLRPLVAVDDVILNYGVSGEDTSDVLLRLTPIVQADVDIIFVMLGSNDARFMRIDLPAYRDNLATIIAAFVPREVVLVTAPPVDERKQSPKRNNRDLAEYANVVRELALQNHHKMIDFYQILSDKPDVNEYLQGQLDDGLHMGISAYELLAQLYATAIDEIKKEALGH